MNDKYSRLGRHPDLRYHVDRVTSVPESEEARRRADVTVTPAMVEDLAKKISGVRGKINTLLDEIKRTAKKTIPVHDKAHEVKKALRDLYGGPDTYITIEQYLRSLEYRFDRNDIDSTEIVMAMTGNAEVDSRILSEKQWETGGVDPKELAIIAGQYMLCMVANRIMQPYSAKNMQQVAAPKIYPGTEVAPSTAQILIGLAALLLQVAQNREEVVGLLEESMRGTGLEGTSADSIVSQAEAQGADDGLSRYNKARTPYYHEVVTRYCSDYVQRSNDPGYESWVVAEPLHESRAEFQQMDSELGTYGKTAEEIDGSKWRMSMDMLRMMLLRSEDMNKQLDRIAAVLRSEMTADLLCCFVSFVGAIPTSQLHMVRMALALYAEGVSIDLSSALGCASLRANTMLSEQVLDPILHAIDRFYNRFVNEALELLDRDNWSDPKAYDLVMLCTPVDELFEYALSGLESLKDLLKQVLAKAWRRLEVKSVKGNLSWRLMADSKRAKVFLSLLDAVIEAVERGNLCAGENTPTYEELEDIVNQLSSGLAAPISVETGGDPYETFNPEPFRSAQGLDLYGQESGSGTEKKSVVTPDCMRKYVSMDRILRSLGLNEPGQQVRSTGVEYGTDSKPSAT